MYLRRGSGARGPDIGMREVIATKQQRLPGDLGQGVAVGVAEVETGRMALPRP